MAQEDLVAVRIEARDVPPPSTISAEARAALSTLAAMPRTAWPDPADLDAWRRQIAESTAMWEARLPEMLADVRAPIETREIAGVPCHVAAPVAGGADDRVYLYLHGGAFVFGGGGFARMHAGRNADRLGIPTVSVDYRMPPDHPFPAAPQDCLAVYRALLGSHAPERIVIGGSSAGGNLAAAVTLMIRDSGLPLPAGVVLLTPEVDLTEAGDSFATNRDLDVVLKLGLRECNAVYAAGHDLTDPYLSPLFADFTRGFPPTLVQTGTRDLFLSNSVRIHRKLRDAGVDAELHVWEAMPHGSFGFGEIPENREVEAEVRRFIGRVCGG